ncbi:CopG family transcriptional regulator, partial [Brasilonema octagenarum UFV-OR1]|nr:CopG family transcriptional regulator [Brasilonema octagenarum UFV-OR1]
MKKLTIRCSDDEYAVLIEYCASIERTQND